MSSPVATVERAVRTALTGPCRLTPGATYKVVVGVSGGPDSLALLHALHRVAGQVGAADLPYLALTVAHFDHGIRAAEARTAERALVAAQAERLGLPFLAGAADVPAVAEREGRGLEESARRCRYRFLGEAARAVGADLVAVGHTATDQAETVLLRLLRGTGIVGLAAMAERSRWPLDGGGPDLIRPLLTVTRDQTTAYCAALDLPAQHDPENESPRYWRNRVRRELLPLLRTFNPAIVDALNRLAASAREVRDVLDAAVKQTWAMATFDGRQVRLPLAALRAQPRAVQAEVLRRTVAHARGEALPPRWVHIEALTRLVACGRGRVSLPGGVYGWVERGEAVIGPVDDAPGHHGGLEEQALVPGVQQVGSWRVEVDGPWPADVRPEERLVAWLRPEVVAQGLTVSSRRRGDRLEPLGMSGTTKKVQDLLVDARLPWAERDAVPIVRVGGRVAWVVGLRIAAWAAAAPGAPAVRVAFRRVDDAEPNGGRPPRPEMGRGIQPGSDTTRPRASSPELLGRFSNSLDGGGEEPRYL